MFGERLRNLREARGLSQKEFADILGVERTRYGKWETKGYEPTFDVLIRIADYFDVSLDYLLGRVEKPQSAKKVLPIDGKDFALTYHKDHEPTDEEAKIAYEAALRALREHHNQD